MQVHVCCILALNFAIVATPLSSMQQATAVWPLMIAACFPFLTALFLARVSICPHHGTRRQSLLALKFYEHHRTPLWLPRLHAAPPEAAVLARTHTAALLPFK